MQLPHGGVISAQQHPTHEIQTAFLLAGTLAAARLTGADIGTNPPALPLTHERIVTLPPARQPAWRKCLGRSERRMQADRAFLKKETRNNGPEKAAAPHEVKGVKGIALDRHAVWHGQPEGRRIADVIVSFQTPSGGWRTKNPPGFPVVS
jgi:hypothetical protein